MDAFTANFIFFSSARKHWVRQARWSPAASSPHPFAVRSRPRSHVRSRPRSQARSSPAASSPRPSVRAAKLAHPQRLLLPTHFQPLPCTHAVRSRPRRQARRSPAASSPRPICRPQPSAQPSSLIPSSFFSPPISTTPQRLLILPTHFQPPPCNHAVRSLIPSGFFFPPISSHSLHPRRQPYAQPSVRAAKLAHPQRLLLPTHFHPLPSAAVRAAKLAHSQRLLLPTHFQPKPCTHAVRSRPRSQARSSPAASSPRPFPATPLHPRRPQPSAQPSSLIPSGFCSPHISRHSLATTPSAAVRAASSLIPSGFFSPSISTDSLAPTPSAAVRAAKFPATPLHPRRPQPSAQPSIPSGFFPHPFPPTPLTHAVHTPPRSQARWSPAASSPHPFPATPLQPRRP